MAVCTIRPAALDGQFGIRVNAVLPGTINTRMMCQIEADSGTSPVDYVAVGAD